MIHKGYRVVFTERETVSLELFELDENILEDDEIFGKTIVSLISPGTELALFRGKRGLTFPIRPGYALIFQVEGVGRNVGDLKKGDYAFCMSTHQSIVKVKRNDIIPIPAGMEPETALFARIAGISMTTLSTTFARPPQMVLVNGLGIVGNVAAQIFRSCGYNLIACDQDEIRREYAINKGVRNVFSNIPLSNPEIAGHVSLVIECRGNEHDVRAGCNIVAQGGEVVLVGVPWERKTDLFAFDLLDAVFHRYAIIRSGWEWELPIHSEKPGCLNVFNNIQNAMVWLKEGRISVSGLYEKIKYFDVRTAYMNLLNRKCKGLTIILDWTEKG